MKGKKFVTLLTTILLLISVLILPMGCSSGGEKDASGKSSSGKPKEETKASKSSDGEKMPEEGPDTNNGRPYNLSPVKYDKRADKYLYGINATSLPIVEEPVTLTVWRGLNSTVMQGWDECEAFKELEKRTNVKIKWIYPPVGQETDNYNLKVSSLDLPDVFVTPPGYTGGYHKAVEDGIYLELTEYYDKGLMPNIKWLRENNEDIDRDIVDDDGKMFFFPMIDIVPTDPWSGLWVREDWIKELGLELPKTIEDWDAMLRAMKKAKGIAPLGLKINDSYGVSNNYAFAASYDTGYDFINKNGKVAYGPLEPGYKDFLMLLNKWYKDGLLDPDFTTRDGDSYNANLANGQYGACGLNYGEMGQAKLSGTQQDPNYKLTPVAMPTSYDGQEIHLHQDNATVRGDRTFFTTQLAEDGLDEVAVKWQDYWYSQDGGDLCSYGPEGVSYEWDDNGEVKWIYPRLKNDEGLDFWTLYPLFKLHNWGYLRNSAAYEFEPEVFESIKVWDSQDSSWLIPDNISQTPEEEKELAGIMTEINTFRDEMTLKFITGQEPLDHFDRFVETVKGMDIDRAIRLKQDALDRYLAR
ncbi:extracellular solute-binding protein [Eubacteriales bacterium mix99]|jgi:putative aldouronate transport system substrate-binding protein